MPRSGVLTCSRTLTRCEMMTKIVQACAISLLLVATSAVCQTTWSNLQPGLELLNRSFPDHGETVPFVLLRCNPKKYRVRIIDTLHELGKANSFAAFSLNEIQNKMRALIIVNGGSTSSYSIPAPAGLLQVGGKTVSPPNYLTERAGVLCITRGIVSILPLSRSQPRCFDAVQRGPYMSREFLSVPDAPSRRYRRTIAAIDGDGQLLILVTNEKATLSSVAAFLYASNSKLDVRSALNLDGDTSSGLIVATGGDLRTVGNIDRLIASAIAIFKAD